MMIMTTVIYCPKRIRVGWARVCVYQSIDISAGVGPVVGYLMKPFPRAAARPTIGWHIHFGLFGTYMCALEHHLRTGGRSGYCGNNSNNN